jgi:molybdate transport system substrate-binding protein
VLILAAASTTDAIEELADAFERAHPRVTIRTSFAASSTLARQIEAGADADVFLSASRQWAEALAEKKLVARQRNLLGNELVIVVPRDAKLEIQRPQDLAGPTVRHVALADPTSVPAGVYARQALEKLGLWKSLARKATGAADVRQALQQVESGAAEAGIVYASDAVASKRVHIAARIDRTLSDEIGYPLVLLQRGGLNAAGVAFYEFLSTPAAHDVFKRHGFLIVSPSSAADRPGQ